MINLWLYGSGAGEFQTSRRFNGFRRRMVASIFTTSNEIIETAYNESEEHVDIILSTDNSSRRIKFNENNCFARQLDIINHKSRCVRRVVITIAKLKEKLEYEQSTPQIHLFYLLL